MASNNSNKRQSSKEDQPMQRVLRQRELVESMKHENEILKLDLTQESRDARKASSSGAAADIARLQDEAARYMKKIEVERAKIAELDKQIIKYQEKILDQKSRLGGVNAAHVNNQLIQKQIKVLDNRLDKYLLKFNETVAHNKELRQKIDEYRRERVVFDVIYKKIERDLHEKKKEMTAIINDSKNAYQLRDKLQSEMAALQERAESTRGLFEMDFKSISESIKEQQATLEKLRLQQFERTRDETKASTSLNEDRSSELTNNLSAWAPGNKEKNLAPLSQEKIQTYEEMLLKIQESTGIFDINELVSKFLEAEEQNFSLFNYINGVNSDIERLEHSISDMRSQIEKFRGQGMSTNTMRKRQIRDIEDRLTKTDKKADEYEARYAVALRTIDSLKSGIQNIFARIGAAATSGVDEKFGNEGVTESNMMQHLGIIEQKTTEILQQYAASQIGLPNENTLQLPSVIAAEATSKPVVADIPSYDDMSSGEDSEGEKDERPLTRHELEERTKRNLARKTGTLTSTFE